MTSATPTYFYSNPYGIQQDGLFAESGGPDNTFDTVWHTTAKLTGNGYMVMIEIPFKSLRFRQQAISELGRDPDTRDPAEL